MNGPSPLSQGERELILAYACAVSGCELVHVAHSEVAYAWGIPQGLVEQLLEDPAALRGYRCTTESVACLCPQAHDRVRTRSPRPMWMPCFTLGGTSRHMHDAVAVTARGAFMHRLIAAYGFKPLSREAAAKKAQKRKALGYVNLYPSFASTPGESRSVRTVDWQSAPMINKIAASAAEALAGVKDGLDGPHQRFRHRGNPARTDHGAARAGREETSPSSATTPATASLASPPC